ncbi:MAG: PAS domain S-box protein [bacterium]|nr:PAS domain S-box protein [bacterium]
MENKTPNYLNWKIIRTGIGAGIFFYIFETIGQVLFFPIGNFARQFFWPDLSHLLFRAAGAGLFAILAAYAQVLIAGRKRIQEDLRQTHLELQAAQENEIRYRLYFKNTTDVIFLVDQNFRIKEISPSVELNLGYHPEDIVGRSFSELSFIDPAYLEKAFSEAQKVLAGETIRDSEYRMIVQDGTCRYESISSVPFYRGQEIVGSISIARDITKRKRIEEELASSEERYKSLVEGAETGIAKIDLEGKFLFVNQALCKLTGYREEEIIGRNFSEFLHPADREQIFQLFANSMASPPESYLDEYRILHKNGWEIYISTKPTLVYENEKLTGVITIIEDVTERKQVQDLVYAQRDLGIALSAADNLGKALRLCLESSMKVSGMDCGGIFLIDEKDGSLKMVHSQGISPDFIRAVLCYDASSPLAVQVRQGKELFITDQNIPEDAAYRNEGLRSTAIIPVLFENKAIASIHVGSHTAGQIPMISRHALISISVQIGDAIRRMKAQEALRESEEMYKTLTETSSDTVVMVDLFGNILRASPRSVEMLGARNPEEIIGRSGIDFIVPEEHERALTNLARAQANGYSHHEEYTFVRMDGSRFRGEMNASLIKDSGGKPKAFILTISDITDRKRAEEAIRESRERYKKLLETFPDLVVITDLEGGIIEVSDNFYDYYGRDKSLEDLKGQGFELLPSGQIEKVRESLQKLFQDGITKNAEYILPMKDGATYIGEMNSVLVKDSHGQPKEIINTIRDITERKRAEETIKESQERYKLLLDTSHDMVVVTDLAGRIIEVSDKFLKHYGVENPVEEVIGQGINLMPPDQMETAMANFPKLLQDGFLNNAEYVLPTMDGKTYIAEVNSAVIKDAGGQPKEIVSTVRDITERKRAEEALRESEERYRTLIENMKDSVAMIDLEGNVLFANKATENLTGYTMAEGIGMNMMEITPPEYQSKSLEALKTALEGKPVNYYEIMIRKKDGTLIPVETGGQVVFREGKMVGIQIVTRDISKRKRTEEALRESEEMYRTLTETTSDAVTVIDLKGNPIRSSQRARELFLGGEQSRTAGNSGLEYIAPEYHEIAGRMMQKVLAEGFIRNIEMVFLREDRTRFHGEVNAALIRNAAGESRAIIAAVRDISERKRIEEAIQRAASEWLSTFDTMSDMVMLIDQNHTILRVNRAVANKLKLPFQEIVGKTCYRLMHGTDAPPSFCPHAKTIAEGKEHTEKIHEPLFDRDYIVTDTPIQDESGQIVRTVHVMRDITDEEKLQASLRRFEKMAAIGEIAGGIAHEIKNPLFAISSSIQVMQDSKRLSKDEKRILDILFQETMRVNRLIKQLLEFGARTRLDRSKQNAGSLINEVIALNRSLLKSKGIRVSKNISPNLPPLWVDKDKITQVLINLIHNAIEVSKKGDRISIICGTDTAKKNLVIRIQDQGPGVPEEIRGKIFAPFFSTKKGNTGMGLAISRKIVAEHGGDIRLEPGPESAGSAFVIELPWEPEIQ